MNENVKGFNEEFNKISNDCQNFCFMSRAKEFQLQACEKLSGLKTKASEIKKQMIAVKDEDSANAMLSFEAMILALMSELKMWIALKEDDPSSAWNFLIAAQDAAQAAMRAHVVASHLEGYIKRLHTLEELLFPSQLFLSTGMIIHENKCSICQKEYGECNHIVGKPYMGEFCSRIITKAEPLEVSIVRKPADKRCRILKITDSGVTRDLLSWKVVSSPHMIDENKSEKKIEGIIFSF